MSRSVYSWRAGAAGVLLCAVFNFRAIAADDAKNPNAEMRYVGRWDLRDPAKAMTINSGSHIIAAFDGTAIRAAFDVSKNQAPFPTIAWKIDDAEWQEAEIKTTVPLADDLKAGDHTITLMIRGIDEHQNRWKAPQVASVTFLGFDLKNGKLLAPPPAAKLKMEVLGDSITEGVLVHQRRPGKETWPWQTDGRLGYACLTAMKLGADWRQVGFGAQGVTRGGSGNIPNALETFDSFFDGCPRDDWQPDLVVINQGTNDGRAPATVFSPAYGKYLEMIRKGYPKAKIAAMRPFNGAHAADIEALVKARNDGGDKETFYIDTTGWLSPGDFTDGVHPNVEGGEIAATKLAEALEKLIKQ